MTPSRLRKRRQELEERVEAIAQLKVEIADRVALAVVAPSAVPDAELRSLREQRRSLDEEQREALAALGLVRRMTAEARSAR